MTKLNKALAELSSMELRGTMEATKQEKSEAAKFLGSLGGKASVKSRFSGKTKEEISQIMRDVRFKNRTKKLNDNPKLQEDVAQWVETAEGKRPY